MTNEAVHEEGEANAPEVEETEAQQEAPAPPETVPTASSGAEEDEAQNEAQSEAVEAEVVDDDDDAAEGAVEDVTDELLSDDDSVDSGEIEIVEPSESEALRADLDKAQKELAEARGRLLRTAADFDNFRKRTAKQADEQRKYGNERVITDFLPVVDNLERALMHAGDEESSGLIDGVRMVLKQFQGTLERHGVKGFQSLHEAFDPERHEAVQQVEREDHPTGTVVEEYQRGYHIHDRLLRPALVVVARNPNEE